MKLKSNEKYEIKWTDITHDNSWTSFDEVDKKILSAEQPMINIGYFMKETKQSYVFYTGADNEGKQYFDLIVFPKGVVKQIKQLK